jgi:putative transcriptional regulator
MTNAYSKIRAGLADVEAFLKNESKGHITHEVPVATPDVLAIRAKSDLSKRAFAQSIGGTLQGWEQGRRRPEGPARVLLALIGKRPGIVREELGEG